MKKNNSTEYLLNWTKTMMVNYHMMNWW